MPDEILRALLRLVETNKGNQTSPAVSSGEERRLVSRTAAGNRAYKVGKGRLSLKDFEIKLKGLSVVICFVII